MGANEPDHVKNVTCVCILPTLNERELGQDFPFTRTPSEPRSLLRGSALNPGGRLGVGRENPKLLGRKLSPFGWAFLSLLAAILIAFLLVGLLGPN